MTKQKLLILGGTEFVGRQLVEYLRKSEKYEISLFNRGKTNADIFPEVKRIIGDRETDDVAQIGEQRWDYVVDFSSYFPGSLQRTLDHLNKDVKRYIYISTISVYSFAGYDEKTPLHENYPKKKYEDHQLTEPSLKYYGEKKVACEDVLKNADWLNAVVLRPAVIFGKYDPTDRLYHWIERIRNRKQIILPESGDYRMSLTYGPDLVATIVSGLHGDLASGTYNCVSDEPYTFRSILEMLRDELKSDCGFVSVPADVLRERKFSTREFPLWWGFDMLVDNSHLRSSVKLELADPDQALRQTARFYAQGNWHKPKVGISHEDEDALLDVLT
ncbi:MAG: NAD-dependent epimerase/dehydratase family protein [Bacteroidota bacterium]